MNTIELAVSVGFCVGSAALLLLEIMKLRASWVKWKKFEADHDDEFTTLHKMV